MRSKEYAAFVKAYDDIDVRCLSDEDLQHYAVVSQNGLIEAEEEKYKRGLL